MTRILVAFRDFASGPNKLTLFLIVRVRELDFIGLDWVGLGWVRLD